MVLCVLGLVAHEVGDPSPLSLQQHCMVWMSSAAAGASLCSKQARMVLSMRGLPAASWGSLALCGWQNVLQFGPCGSGTGSGSSAPSLFPLLGSPHSSLPAAAPLSPPAQTHPMTPLPSVFISTKALNLNYIKNGRPGFTASGSKWAHKGHK